MGQLIKYMDDKLIAFLDEPLRDEALAKLVDVINEAGYLPNRKEFYEAIVAREKIVSTGIGMGVAIPHAKLPHYQDFFIAVGVLKRGIDWSALDAGPVRLIFMIGGPDNKQTEYLQILSRLTVVIKDEEKRKKMLAAHDADSVMSLFKL